MTPPKDKKIVCIHHNDLDGICSAAIVKKVYPDTTFIEGVYGVEPSYKKIDKDDVVFMVDYAPPTTEGFKRLLKKTKNVVWIDHHKTQNERYGEFSGLEGIRIDTVPSAAELTWKYFFNSDTMPACVRYVSLYDTQTYSEHDLYPEYFNAGLHLGFGVKPSDDIWPILLTPKSKYYTRETTNILARGEAIYNFRVMEAKETLEKRSFETKFFGYNAVVCNVYFPNMLAKVCDREKYDILIAYSHLNQKTIKFSLRSLKPDINCSVLAQKYGGGGHPMASGFISSVMPF